MIKRPCEVEKATYDWTAFAISGNDARKDEFLEKEFTSDKGPLSCNDKSADESAKKTSCAAERHGENSTTCSSQNEESENFGFAFMEASMNGIQVSHTNDQAEIAEVDKSIMDLPGLTLCYESDQGCYNQKTQKETLSIISINEDCTVHQNKGRVSREIVDNYCRMLQELDRCRDEISKLKIEKNKLKGRLDECCGHLDHYKHAVKSEKSFRERIQDDLRRIVNEVDNYNSQSWSTLKDQPSCITEADIEYYKDQFRAYQEDFKQEKEEKLKLRELNSLLKNELDEAKQTIESHEKKLRVYAQLFPNGREAQVVIPPAYIGRRVRSNPPSPSYTQCFSRTVQQISELRDMEEMQQRRPEYDPIFDIVPKGSAHTGGADKRQLGRRTSVAYGELQKETDNFSNRGRANSIGSCKT